MSVAVKKRSARTDNGGKAAEATPEQRVRSAAAPSPFTPIADYAFLSDCHTGALVANALRGGDHLLERMGLRPTTVTASPVAS